MRTLFETSNPLSSTRVFAFFRKTQTFRPVSLESISPSLRLLANCEPEVARRALELGLLQNRDLLTDIGYVLHYAAFLEQRGDARNALALS